MQNQGEAKKSKSSLGVRAWFPIKGCTQYLWAILQIPKSLLGWRIWWLTTVCCPQACRHLTSWTWSLRPWTPTYLTTNPSEECYKLIMPSLNNCYKTFHYLPQMGDRCFWGHEATVFPFAWQSNKALLFYFTQNFVRFFSALLYKESELSASSLSLGHCVTSPLRNFIFSPGWDDSYCIF